MLIIRDEQMQALQEARHASFEDELVRDIARNFLQHYLKLTNQGRDEAAIRRLIHTAIERAVKYGIRAEADVRRFVEMTITIAPDFEFQQEWQWAKVILDDDSLSGEAKIALIKSEERPG